MKSQVVNIFNLSRKGVKHKIMNDRCLTFLGLLEPRATKWMAHNRNVFISSGGYDSEMRVSAGPCSPEDLRGGSFLPLPASGGYNCSFSVCLLSHGWPSSCVFLRAVLL